ncbi:FAR1 DNA-binding domain [Sesbania bispinosa]|nr:FAR1 DNA-binding domain [Sesbania bispinosa]
MTQNGQPFMDFVVVGLDKGNEAEHRCLEESTSIVDGVEVQEPYVGMEFDSEEAARKFYVEYARRVGFVVRIMQRRRSGIDGRTLARRLGCNKQGFSPNNKGALGPEKKPRPSAREGCKATILVKLEKSGKWVVTRFIKDHNHPLIATANGFSTALLIEIKIGIMVKDLTHALILRTSDLKPHQQVDLFTAGLVEELKIDIEMQQPGNLGIAMNMARALECKQRVSQGTLISRTSMSWPSSKNTRNSFVLSTNRNSNARGGGQTTKQVGSSSKVGASAPFVKRLTRVEMEMTKVNQRKTTISLHAISGVRESHTMQLLAKVLGVDVLVLVDSGSTHNFLCEGLIPSLGLEVLKRLGLQVYAENGE